MAWAWRFLVALCLPERNFDSATIVCGPIGAAAGRASTDATKSQGFRTMKGPRIALRSKTHERSVVERGECSILFLLTSGFIVGLFACNKSQPEVSVVPEPSEPKLAEPLSAPKRPLRDALPGGEWWAGPGPGDRMNVRGHIEHPDPPDAVLKRLVATLGDRIAPNTSTTTLYLPTDALIISVGRRGKLPGTAVVKVTDWSDLPPDAAKKLHTDLPKGVGFPDLSDEYEAMFAEGGPGVVTRFWSHARDSFTEIRWAERVIGVPAIKGLHTPVSDDTVLQAVRHQTLGWLLLESRRMAVMSVSPTKPNLHDVWLTNVIAMPDWIGRQIVPNWVKPTPRVPAWLQDAPSP